MIRKRIGAPKEGKRGRGGGARMLDAAGDFFEERVLPPEERRPTTSTVVGTVAVVCYALVGALLLVQLL